MSSTGVPSEVVVVGIGADGWASLPESSRSLVLEAAVLWGGSRHLSLVPAVPGQVRVPWPSPLSAGLPSLLAEYAGRAVVALASGDPLVSGIASTLLDLGAPVRVVPAVSSVALARARMGWSAESCAVVSLVGRPVSVVARELAPGRRILVLSSDASTPDAVAGLLTSSGWGASRMTVLGDLGSSSESSVSGVASSWSVSSPRLNVIALEVSGNGLASWAPGLPDDAFESDGQLTKRDLRASALARLMPAPGQVLWDVGAGAGSVGIEWMRAHPTCLTFAIESDPVRADRIMRNAQALGVPDLELVIARAPDALEGLPAPDAIFIGGGATRQGVLDTCLFALKPGGRLVVHGVTLETEMLLAKAYGDHGGGLTRIGMESAAPVGTFTGWTPARAVTQWTWNRAAT
ncbi:precorrin-6y C5,15-methyltransferase (decarboxylating) subunit CbiE [Nocardioides ganghwensis]|uniref:Precorrin-6y C5,15-methyltransferase (Decarboxylating) subunit CbiE n=1 Tax=Nocardioides ganghwensis TaxID=252230 RepID=A0A4Q2SLQ5_9ACTN|nr:precorrin-6y C5,15-methyltransferase (decarboxylating) subunit CbiE [Nocardioides ganghwensis]MBD3945083.1 precorrin-6y C5,15-methyltransferase (decarboxylating) subunit CbiE [Nocardioides ganghwensis]RYC04928.1 precorrin-6y C5,15-methyltransferase (decarboxylating) subunit CbiE [Nocardioides ganghwensis]